MMAEPRPREIPDATVREATGRDWAEWTAWLGERGGADLSHPRLVALLGTDGGVESSWWRQSIANAFERRTGRRVRGETADGTFQIGVRRTLPLAPAEAWRRLTSPAGAARWLGEPAEPVDWSPGSVFRLADGSTGEVRVCRPGSMIRLHLRAPGAGRASVIQVRVDEAATGATVGFHQEQLADADAREARRAHYAAVLDTFADTA